MSIQYTTQSSKMWTDHLLEKGTDDEISKALDSGAPLTCRVMDGQKSLLHLAAWRETDYLARKVLEQKVDVNEESTDGCGYTPLHEAVVADLSGKHLPSIDVIRCLLTNGANVNARRKDHSATPLHDYVMNYGETTAEGLQLLIDHKADVNMLTEEGLTALHLLAMRANDDELKEKALLFIDILISNEAKVDIKDSNGKTYLDYLDI